MMTDEAKKNENEDELAENAGEAKVGSGRGLVIAFVATIVLLESAMFFFMVPSAEQVSAMAEAQLIESVQEDEREAEEMESNENKVIEIQIGQFGETFSPIDTEREFRLELSLYGLIQEKNKERIDKEIEEKQGRIRHAIRMKIRTSALTELQENQLGLLERRILTTCNHLLEKDYFLGVGFNNYQLIPE